MLRGKRQPNVAISHRRYRPYRIIDQPSSSRYNVMQSNTHQMAHHSHKKIKEQRRPTPLHLHLHGPTTLESISTADDEREVMCSQFGITGRSVAVSETGAGKDGAALDAGLETLFFEGQALEFGEFVAVGGALSLMSISCCDGDGGVIYT